MKKKKYRCGCWLCTSSKEKKHISRKKHDRHFRDRIDNYLGNGGFFNPECMDHDKVSDLLQDVREYMISRVGRFE